MDEIDKKVQAGIEDELFQRLLACESSARSLKRDLDFQREANHLLQSKFTSSEAQVFRLQDQLKIEAERLEVFRAQSGIEKLEAKYEQALTYNRKQIADLTVERNALKNERASLNLDKMRLENMIRKERRKRAQKQRTEPLTAASINRCQEILL